MRKSWIVFGALVLAVCFAAGLVMSRTGPASFERLLPVAPPVGPGAQWTASTSAATPADDATPWRDPQVGHFVATVAPELPGDVLEHAIVEPVGGDEPASGRYRVETQQGERITLTLDDELQSAAETLLRRYEPPHGAVVAVEVRTGRVLALASYEAEPTAEDRPVVALRTFAPSASLFKIVTAAALIEDGQLSATTTTCVHGGTRSLSDEAIVGHPQLDTYCLDLATAFGLSNNSVFARRAHDHLDADKLGAWATRFGYGAWLPFNLETEPSRAAVPAEQLAMARTAAGFWNTDLSPLHAALLSASVANGGVMMRPNIVESVEDVRGSETYTFAALPYRRVMEPATARIVADLMVRTTTVGTASRVLRRTKLPEEYLPAGKTGTLAQTDPYLLFSWFSGFAPIDNPDVAIAVLVSQPMKWRVKATWIAAEMYRTLARRHETRLATSVVMADNTAAASDTPPELGKSGDSDATPPSGPPAPPHGIGSAEPEHGSENRSPAPDPSPPVADQPL